MNNEKQNGSDRSKRGPSKINQRQPKYGMTENEENGKYQTSSDKDTQELSKQ